MGQDATRKQLNMLSEFGGHLNIYCSNEKKQTPAVLSLLNSTSPVFYGANLI